MTCNQFGTTSVSEPMISHDLVQASMWSGSTSVHAMTSCLFSGKPLPDVLLIGSLRNLTDWVDYALWTITCWRYLNHRWFMWITWHGSLLSESSQGQLDPQEPTPIKENRSTIFSMLETTFKNVVGNVSTILFRRHYKIFLDMEVAMDTEQSAFSPVKHHRLLVLTKVFGHIFSIYT